MNIDEKSSDSVKRTSAEFWNGLFYGKRERIFDINKLSTQVVDEFVASKEALSLFKKFMADTDKEWEKKYQKKLIPNFLNEVGRLVSPERGGEISGQLDSVPSKSPAAVNALPDKTSTEDSDLDPIKKNTPLKPGSIPASGLPTLKPPFVERSPLFKIPNAQSGKPYQGQVTAEGQENVTVVEMRLPDDLGLTFDEDKQEISGTPSKAGDHTIPLQWVREKGEMHSGKLNLIINANPRDLWKNLEPDQNAPFAKPNEVSSLIKTQEYQIAAASRRGRSHAHIGTFRDDDYFINRLENGWCLMIVADGAGSAPFSREGSRLAVTTSGDLISGELSGDLGAKLEKIANDWIATPEDSARAANEEFHYLFHRAGTAAVKAIEDEATSTNAKPKEFSTTLLVAVARRDGEHTFLATFWMGDGAIAAYGPKGKIRLMGSPDAGEYAGQTRFLDREALTDQGFSKRIRIGRLTDLMAITLMTDGISDPIFETDNGLQDVTRWDTFWEVIEPYLNSEQPDSELLEWMDFFSPGHHDDRTIAIMW